MKIKSYFPVILAVDDDDDDDDEADSMCRAGNLDIPFIIPLHKDWNEDFTTNVVYLAVFHLSLLQLRCLFIPNMEDSEPFGLRNRFSIPENILQIIVLPVVVFQVSELNDRFLSTSVTFHMSQK